ncbi:MAG TPA: J domain-containing protein [Rubrobacter sp.]|nr:J domain-containing protein [Rubrobacter sp.]
MKDPYGLLGVSRGASEEDVRKAYRRLAREYHPDANPGDIKAEDRFKEIQQAYEILSNPNKRREYDERSRPSSRKRRPGSSSKATRGSRKTTTSASGGRDSGREINWHLKVEGVEDIARISRILGMDLTRLSKLAGDGIKRKTSFGKSGSADASGEKPSKPPKPPKPPKTRKRPDA